MSHPPSLELDPKNLQLGQVVWVSETIGLEPTDTLTAFCHIFEWPEDAAISLRYRRIFAGHALADDDGVVECEVVELIEKGGHVGAVLSPHWSTHIPARTVLS